MNKLFLRKKLYLLRMNDGDLVIEHLNAFNTIISQQLFIDIKVTEEDNALVCCVDYQTLGIVSLWLLEATI